MALSATGRRWLLALFLFSSSGCMTMLSQSHFWTQSSDGAKILAVDDLYIYGGAVNDAVWFAVAVSQPSPAAILFLLDFPLSFAADTCLLPLTVSQQIYRARSHPPQEAEERSTALVAREP